MFCDYRESNEGQRAMGAFSTIHIVSEAARAMTHRHSRCIQLQVSWQASGHNVCITGYRLAVVPS